MGSPAQLETRREMTHHPACPARTDERAECFGCGIRQSASIKNTLIEVSTLLALSAGGALLMLAWFGL